MHRASELHSDRENGVCIPDDWGGLCVGSRRTIGLSHPSLLSLKTVSLKIFPQVCSLKLLRGGHFLRWDTKSLLDFHEVAIARCWWVFSYPSILKRGIRFLELTGMFKVDIHSDLTSQVVTAIQRVIMKMDWMTIPANTLILIVCLGHNTRPQVIFCELRFHSWFHVPRIVTPVSVMTLGVARASSGAARQQADCSSAAHRENYDGGHLLKTVILPVPAESVSYADTRHHVVGGSSRTTSMPTVTSCKSTVYIYLYQTKVTSVSSLGSVPIFSYDTLSNFSTDTSSNPLFSIAVRRARSPLSQLPIQTRKTHNHKQKQHQ